MYPTLGQTRDRVTKVVKLRMGNSLGFLLLNSSLVPDWMSHKNSDWPRKSGPVSGFLPQLSVPGE